MKCFYPDSYREHAFAKPRNISFKHLVILKILTDHITYQFISQPPEGYSGTTELITGDHSKQFPSPDYLLINYHDGTQQLFEIRTEFTGFAKKEIILTDTLLAVGIYDHFFIYNTVAKINLTGFNVSYFQAVFFHNNCFYVSGLDRVYCFESSGKLKWESDSVAHDGVLINEIQNETISGQGGWDPPDGIWTNFTLNIHSGKLIT